MSIVKAQNDPVLMTIAGKPVNKSEFERVYKKNNNKDISYDSNAVHEYLELYINYKLKVQAALDEKLDTASSFVNELAGYRKQLAQPYMTDTTVSTQILREAYERMQKDVRASHVLVRCAPDALPKDTSAAYTRIMKIRDLIIKKKMDFTKVARDSSDDPSAKENGGDLGYFTGMQMVYPFESVAYSTPVGQVSMPVRTRFGYHIIKVSDMRPAQGEIHCAHIMIKVTAGVSDADTAAINAKTKINEIYAKLKTGDKFEDLAGQFSEDKGSAKNGGVLPWFGTGRMVPEFEKAAFALKNDGDYTEPIRSSYGWHIIKRLEKRGIPSFDEKKADLKQQIARDSRSEASKQAMINKIKTEYGFKEFIPAKEEFLKTLDSSIVKGEFTDSVAQMMKKPIINIGNANYTQADFAAFIVSHQTHKTTGDPYTVGSALYDSYVSETLLAYEESRLEEKYPEFKNLMQEYRDGILLFDLTDKKVWSRAVKDSTGLVEFYGKNKGNYMWGERLSATIYTCANEAVANDVRKLLKKKGITSTEVLDQVNKESQLNLSVKEGKYVTGDNDIIDSLQYNVPTKKTGASPYQNLTKGLTPNFNKNGQVIFVDVKEVIAPQSKSLDESKGLVTADYQSYLEKNWIEELRKKYPVQVNEPVLNTIIKK
ncbi:MAG: peptidylprolyl isomerase [Bacteroidia bacterium]